MPLWQRSAPGLSSTFLLWSNKKSYAIAGKEKNIERGETDMKTIRIEVSISAPPDLVWWAWTKPDRITVWFAPEAIIEARPGGPFELFFDLSDHEHQCTKGCVFTLVEPKKRLGFTWKGPDEFADLMNNPTSITSVLVTLYDENGTTRVVVEHRGWGEGEESAASTGLASDGLGGGIEQSQISVRVRPGPAGLCSRGKQELMDAMARPSEVWTGAGRLGDCG